MQITNAVIEEATENTQKSGYDTSHFYTVQVDETGKTELTTTQDSNGLSEMQNPDRSGYQGYLVGSTVAPNGATFGHGVSFPTNAEQGDYFLRTDFLPNRLFKYANDRWNKVQDVVRTELYGSDNSNTQKGGFINNTNTTTVAGETFEEKQSLSEALRTKADN